MPNATVIHETRDYGSVSFTASVSEISLHLLKLFRLPWSYLCFFILHFLFLSQIGLLEQ